MRSDSSRGSRQLAGQDYSITIFAGDEMDLWDGNVDVEVRFRDGRRYVGTVFTYKNIQTLFDRYAETGECSGGLYVWGSNMVVVRDLRDETIAGMVAGLVAAGELDGAFSPVRGEDTGR